MKLKSFRLENFLSFENIILELRKNQEDPAYIYNVTGVNEDIDGIDDSSNGSGKSSIFGENICFNLYSKPLRGNKKSIRQEDMIQYGKKDMKCEIEYFLDDGKILTIQRSKSRRSQAICRILENGEDISSRTKKITDEDIKQYFQMPFEIFTQSVISYTNNQNMMYMNYTEKLNLFKQLIKIEFLDDLYNNTRLYRDDNNNKLRKLIHDKESVEEMISLMKKNKDNQLSYFQEELKNAKDKLSSVLEKKKKLPSTEQQEKDRELLQEEDKKARKQIETIEKQKYLLETQIKNIKKEVRDIEKLKAANCPTCGQEVSEEYVDNILKDKFLVINTHNDNIELFQNSIDIYEKERMDIKKTLQEVQSKINEIEILHTKANTLIKTCENDIKKYEREYEQKKKEMEDNKDEDILKYEKRLSEINMEIKKRNIDDKYINFYYDILSPKSELRSAIYNKHIVILSELFQSYLNRMFNGYLIGSIEINMNSEIDIKIKTIEGYDTNYFSLSSGERQQFDLSLNLAMYDFVGYSSITRPNFILMDEPFCNIDPNRINNTVEVIGDIYKKYNCDIFIITHTKFPEEILLNMGIPIKNIIVTKRNGISTVQMENI